MSTSPERWRLPRQPDLNIGTSGHVDHGKTTLVQAITGIWTSAHSEELRRGITIKVGYADAAIYRCPTCAPPENYSTSPKCPNCGAATELVKVVSFVDAPGHESLMANMLSGAALMDGAILVIAANESVPQPQTREHLLALQMLGLKQIVIAQNKIDLVDDAAARESYERIGAFAAGTVAENAPIIPISAQHNLNIDALLYTLEERIQTPTRNPNADPLLHVLRSFDVNRPGTEISGLTGGVLGGTLVQGELEVDSEVELRPGILNPRTSKYDPVTSRIVSLGTGAGMVEKVKPGGLVAIGTPLDPTLTKSDGLVGTVLGKPGKLPEVYDSLQMETHLFETAVGTPEQIKVERVATSEALRLNIGTAVTLGVVSSARDGRIEAKLRRPVCALEGSRAALSRRIGDRWRLIGSGLLE